MSSSLMRLIRAVIVLAAVAGATAQAPAKTADGSRMTPEKYATYLKRFNAQDVRYSELYAKDVVFRHDPMFGVLRGRQAIIDFYRKIDTELKETVTASTVVIDNEHGLMAAELTTQLLATRDGVKMPSGVINKGDRLIVYGTVYYGLKDGHIVTIRGGKEGHQLIRASESPHDGGN